ncbi:glutathione transferase GST 23-like [Eucalyptus grandis]|uniref:glutathione transferase GST 23-like n=1 Tax=Eucalyptus grandis TaxID=71139 RepID=UPI00192E9B4F|nr:glutathione transferase GST 23-like [Eucalyptus grandis]
MPAVMAMFSSKGEEQQKAVLQARESLKTLESGLEGKPFFGGETINFADVATGWIGCWARIVEEITSTSLIDAEKMPSLDAWFKRFLDVPVIKECMPPWDKLIELNSRYHKMLVASSK